MNIRPIDGAQLTEISETSLMTLWQRAREAARANPIISDPMAIELTHRIDYDFDRFVRPSQVFAIRALAFDSVIRDYVKRHPNGTVIALAEGLQTTYWRVGEPEVHWVSLDLPAVTKIRRALLPHRASVRHLAGSAFDLTWTSEIDADTTVLICIEGLLQYFPPERSLWLLDELAGRFRRSQIVLDTIPRWIARRSEQGKWPGNAPSRKSSGFQNPSLPFALSAAGAQRLAQQIDGISAVRTVPMTGGRGAFGMGLSTIARTPLLKNLAPSVIVADTV